MVGAGCGPRWAQDAGGWLRPGAHRGSRPCLADLADHSLQSSVLCFVEDPEFGYKDFTRRGEQAPPTFRAQVGGRGVAAPARPVGLRRAPGTAGARGWDRAGATSALQPAAKIWGDPDKPGGDCDLILSPTEHLAQHPFSGRITPGRTTATRSSTACTPTWGSSWTRSSRWFTTSPTTPSPCTAAWTPPCCAGPSGTTSTASSASGRSPRSPRRALGWAPHLSHPVQDEANETPCR